MEEQAFLDKFGVTVLWRSLKSYINKIMPKKTSDLTNDSSFITGVSTLTFTGAQEAVYNGKQNVTINIPESTSPGGEGTTNYNQLQNKPSINGTSLVGNKTLSDLGINIPTKVSQLTNDSDYATQSSLANKVNRTELAKVATSGKYSDLTGKPTIPTIPSNVSAFTNDAGYLTQHQDISGKVGIAELNSRLSNIYTKTEVNDLIDAIITEGGEVDLTNYYKKTEADSRFQPVGNYLTSHQDISGKADTSDLKTVAFTGAYSDLISKPTINGKSLLGNTWINAEDIYYNEGQYQPYYIADGDDINTILQVLDFHLGEKPDSSYIVHKAGNETITGNKTFATGTTTSFLGANYGEGGNITINLPSSSNAYIERVIDDDQEGHFSWIQDNMNGHVVTLQDTLDSKAPVSTTVTLTGSQRLTNKTIYGPTITGAASFDDGTVSRYISIEANTMTDPSDQEYDIDYMEILQHANDVGFRWIRNGSTNLQTVLDSKQDSLVSGTNIKTINGNSILGSGNITISGGGTGSSSKLYVYDSTDGITYNGDAVASFDDFLTATVHEDCIKYGGKIYRLKAVQPTNVTIQNITSLVFSYFYLDTALYIIMENWITVSKDTNSSPNYTVTTSTIEIRLPQMTFDSTNSTLNISQFDL